MENFTLPEGIQFEDPEGVKQAILNICRDAKIFGRAGGTNLPAVKCDVEGLTLGHWYKLWDALGKEVNDALNSASK